MIFWLGILSTTLFAAAGLMAWLYLKAHRALAAGSSSSRRGEQGCQPGFTAGVTDIPERRRMEDARHCEPVGSAGRVAERTHELQEANESLRRIQLELEQRVQARTAELRAVIDALPDQVFRLNADAVVVADPAGGGASSGAAADRAVGRPIGDLLAGEAAGAIAEGVSRALRYCGSVTLDYTQVTDGESRDFEARCVPLAGGDALAIVRDITYRKRTERALQRSEERAQDRLAELDLIYRTAPVGLCLLDTHLRYVRINDRMAEINARPAQWHIGRHVGEVIPLLAPTIEWACRRVIETGQPVEDVLIRGETAARPGETRTWQASYYGVPGETGIVGVGVVIQDITERRRAEAALRESEERFRALAEHSSVGIWQITADRRSLYLNPAMCRMIEVEQAHEILGQFTDRFFTPKSQEVVKAEHVKRRGGQPSTYEVELAGARGGKRTALLSGAPLMTSDGALASMIGSFIDITERQAAEGAARQHLEALARVARISTMGEMAAGLAHEINQPLAAIVNYARGCIRRFHAGTDRADELLTVLDKIAVQAERGGAILRRLRDFVRKHEPMRRPTDMNALVRDVLALLEIDAGRHRVEVRLDLAPEVPTAIVDDIQIQQVLLNLVRNAIEATTDDAGGARVVTVSTRPDPGRENVRVAVTDRGRGIAAEHVERLFEPFFTTKPEGLGMGLSISRSIIEAHGGELSAATHSEGGATFEFWLPVRPGTQDAAVPSPRSRCAGDLSEGDGSNS